MMNRREEREDNWDAVCELFGLSDEEKEAVMAFLSDQAGEEALLKLSFRDISEIPSDTLDELSKEFLKKREKKVLSNSKLFLLLFAIGQSTCYKLFDRMYTRIGLIQDIDPVKRTAVYGASTGKYSYYINSYLISDLIKSAEDNPKIIRQALDYEKSKKENGRAVLYTIYFFQKYRKYSGQTKTIKEEDRALMEQYEKSITECLCSLYFTVAQPLLDELRNCIASGEMPQLLNYPGISNVERGKFRQVVALAYLNYPLSDKLKNIVRVCMAVNWSETLEAMRSIGFNNEMDLRERGGNYDKIFGIDSEKYIEWAVRAGYHRILQVQISQNKECYLRVMDRIDLDFANKMLFAIEKQEPTLYRKLIEEKRLNGKDKERLIDSFAKMASDADISKAYLNGECSLEEFHSYFGKDISKAYYSGGREYTLLNNFHKIYNDEEFYRRCEVYMLSRRASYFFSNVIIDDKNGKKVKENTKKLFADFETEGVALADQVSAIGLINDSLYSENNTNDFLGSLTEYFLDCLKERREETISAFAGADAFGRLVGLRLLIQDAEKNKKEILRYMSDGSKAVKQELFDFLCRQKGWEEEIKSFLDSKKASEREFAARIMSDWQKDGSDYKELFAQAMEKEKNAKVRELLGNILGVSSGEEDSGKSVLSREEMVKGLHKGGRKRSLSWAYQTPFSEVHYTDGSTASEEYLQALLLCYASSDQCGVSKNAEFLAETLQAGELAVYVSELYEKWLAAGAESKRKWVLYAACVHGGSEMIQKLKQQIKDWPKNARGAIACEAVKAMSISPQPQALLTVDEISRKFKYRQVRAAAGAALEFAASQLGITREELADRIIPNFGFDDRMERRFDYGERSFKILITPSLEFEVFDESGKKLKNLPAPGKRDDETKAKAAYEEFKFMKKQLKTTAASQKERLELALSTARMWNADAWKTLFVKNPVMHQFAIGLVWGFYKEGKLVQSFRYMEDGSFNTEDEEEYNLPEDGKIGLVHPMELTDESRKVWIEQMEDYEIVQPIDQLNRTVYKITEEEANQKELKRFNGRTVNDLSLNNKIMGSGWYRGPVLIDGGGFETYYREDAELGLGAELNFSGTYVCGLNEDVTICDVRFYKLGEVESGCCLYTEKKKNNKALLLKDIPERYFSEIVWQLNKVTV